MIGGDFLFDKDLFLNKKKNNLLKSLENRNYYLFNSGRSSISFILLFLSKKYSVKKAYLPFFSCETIKETFKYYNFKIVYYSSNIKNNQKYNFSKNSVVLFINYFGHENLNFKKQVIQKKKNLFIIEDSVQSCLSEKSLKNNIYDFQISSLRKFLPVPDGSLLISKYKIIEKIETTNISQLTKAIIAKLLKFQKIVSDNVYLRIHSESEKFFTRSKKIFVMSNFSKFLLDRLDIENFNRTRVKNWKIVNNFFKNKNYQSKLEPLFKTLNRGDVPLGFPILVNFNREKFLNYLKLNKIYCPIHWVLNKRPLKNYLLTDFNISKRILTIPIDQRVTNSKLLYMLRLIDSYINKIA